MGKVYENDSGTVLSLATGIDLSTGITSAKILIKHPSGTETEHAATKSGNSLEYELLPADISVNGTYTAITYIESASFPTGKAGEPFTFSIYKRFT